MADAPDAPDSPDASNTSDASDASSASDASNASSASDASDDTGAAGASSGTPTFTIPERPERVYTAEGGVEYEGGSVFSLVPEDDRSTDELASLVADVLDDDRYVSGDWFDLPAPVYLVHDREVSTSFRVVVRDGRVRLHVLPDTRPEGLAELYRRLDARSDAGWTTECRTV